MNSFLDLFKQIAHERAWPERMSPASLAEQWDGFVGECEEGYSMGWDEYRNDLQCRSFIEVVLTSPLLQGQPELPAFEAVVREIDQRFRSLLIPDLALPLKSAYWWELSVPNNAGEELRADLESIFKISVINKPRQIE